VIRFHKVRNNELRSPAQERVDAPVKDNRFSLAGCTGGTA
jgi:hypothetical protein